jgi:hypothetical protein
VQYALSSGKIKETNLGGFYWVRVTVPKGGNSFVINQSITTGNFQKLFAIASGSAVFDPSCTKVSAATFTQSSTTGTTGTVTVTFNAPSAGTYTISVKFSTKDIIDQATSNPSRVGNLTKKH